MNNKRESEFEREGGKNRNRKPEAADGIKLTRYRDTMIQQTDTLAVIEHGPQPVIFRNSFQNHQPSCASVTQIHTR